MTWLETLLWQQGMSFDAVKRHIWCFAHIMNLACKAVLTTITNLDHALDRGHGSDFIPPPGHATNFHAACQHDPIATIRTVVHVIRASSIQHQIFSEILEALEADNLQLFLSFFYYFAIETFLASQDFPELHWYQLSDAEWDALSNFREILAVPHAFQQILSAEKTPCISDMIPAFEVMRSMWEKLETEMPHAKNIIHAGLNKLAEYRNQADDVDAYFIAIFIHPSYKMQWFCDNMPGRVSNMKSLFTETIFVHLHSHLLQILGLGMLLPRPEISFI
ncbi:ribonuclease H-like domain-containing protein [Armillaria borealis]|uniref:Ribonuclease H-like domain-containing protein n=1 Tax=Armillaria borealis TaxID=47425 RepID=A0AA39J8P0_9AGAR|nr:ribonuclease H-like domain-containing protein [Armillaria borealis]